MAANLSIYLILFCFILILVKSDLQRCMNGFTEPTPHNVSARGHENFTTVRLIPGMNFSCNGEIVWLTIAGQLRLDEQYSQYRYPKLHIWRRTSELLTFIQTDEVALNPNVCIMGTWTNVSDSSDVYQCSLKAYSYVSFQRGDFIGLELPPRKNATFLLYFTEDGPTNTIYFQGHSTPFTTENAQPQITLGIRNQPCMSGFTEPTLHNASARGHENFTTVRLIPRMRFSCDGEIVWLKVAGQLRLDEQYSQYPKLHIWRRSSVWSGWFIRTDSEVALSSNVCIMGKWTNVSDSSDVYQCSLEENTYISFQGGDFIALELPPRNNATFLLYFTDQDGPTNSIYFQGNTTPFAIENAQPQITLGIRRSEMVSTAAPEMMTSTSRQIVSTAEEPGISPIGGAGIATGIAIVLLLIILIVLIVVCFLRLNRKRSSFISRNNVNVAYSNPVYCNNQSGAEVATADYDEIKDGTHTEKISFEKCQLEADCELTKANYFILTEQPPQEEVDSLCKTQSDEDATYWEPADSINELYKQLSSKKYREINPNQVKLTGVLGSGEFGRVSKGVWESPMGGMDVAVKQLQPGASEEEKVKFLQEAAINGQFRHPNVVKLMGVVTTGEPIMIVLELLSKGDLRTFLNDQRQSDVSDQNLLSVDQQELLRFCQQIASGMDYLSKKGFVHRDLAARNILVSGDHMCKISDFGMSRNLMDENYYISHGGKIPVKWTAPEAIHYKKYSPASDVWSFGCVMHEIWSLGQKPFEIYTNPEVIKMVDQGHRLPPPPGLTKELYRIMIECWQPESSHRPTFSQLVEMLSRADFELFAWEEDDLKGCDQRVKVVGAPLELAQNLYTDLQNMYK